MRIYKKMLPQHPKIITEIKNNVRAELAKMIDVWPSEAKDDLLLRIVQEWDAFLDLMQNHLEQSAIYPFAQIAVSEAEFPKSFYSKALRIGFYPISANPLHWGHLLVGVSAIARPKLDKIIFIIAGEDPKKDPAPTESRHAQSQSILKKFFPFFEYSNIAKNTALDGETNIFKILSLNPFQKIDASYIAGRDHYHRIQPELNKPDTIQKLEENIAKRIYGYNDMAHSISVLFVERQGGSAVPIPTSLKIEILPPVQPHISSTLIRHALISKNNKAALAFLPASIYEKIYADVYVFPSKNFAKV